MKAGSFHFNDAVTSYKQAIQLQDTNMSKAGSGLGRAQISAESIPEATSTLKLALERFPNEARLKVVYARMLLTTPMPATVPSPVEPSSC